MHVEVPSYDDVVALNEVWLEVSVEVHQELCSRVTLSWEPRSLHVFHRYALLLPLGAFSQGAFARALHLQENDCSPSHSHHLPP